MIVVQMLLHLDRRMRVAALLRCRTFIILYLVSLLRFCVEAFFFFAYRTILPRA